MARRGENIHKRKDGRWEARIIEGYHSGKSKYRSIYGRTYTEVKAKREEVLAKLSLKPVPAAKKLASFDFMASDWLQSVRSTVKESTYSRYHRMVTVYLLPKLGNVQLIKLSSDDINRITAELQQNGGKRGQGLSPKTVADMLSVLKLILRHGTKQGYACPDVSSIDAPKKKTPKIKTLPRVKYNGWNNDCGIPMIRQVSESSFRCIRASESVSFVDCGGKISTLCRESSESAEQ